MVTIKTPAILIKSTANMKKDIHVTLDEIYENHNGMVIQSKYFSMNIVQ